MYLGQVQLDAPPRPRRRLDGRAGEPGGPQVLNGGNRAGVQGFETGLDQHFLQKRVADLHCGAQLHLFLEGAGREAGGAVDAVAARFRPHQQQHTANFPGRGRGDSVFGDQAHAHGVDQRIVGVGRVEIDLAAHVGHPNTIAVPRDAADHAIEQVAVVGFVERSEAQGVQQRDGPRSHRQDVPHDAADAGGGALQRLHRRGVVVGLHLEHHGQPVADVHHAGVLGPGLRQDPGRLLGEHSEQGPGMFVAAVFAPQRPEHAQLNRVGLAAQPLHDHFVFSPGQGYRVQDVFAYRHGVPFNRRIIGPPVNSAVR